MNIKIEELLSALNRKEEEKEKNTVLWVLAIIGAVAAVAGIAFAVYHFFAPDYLEDFEEDFDDDFEFLCNWFRSLYRFHFCSLQDYPLHFTFEYFSADFCISFLYFPPEVFF